MDKQSNAKDFFINLGAIVGLYTVVYSLIDLLFTVINKAYPQITNGYDYVGSQSISRPVAILIIFFPIFILLMWLLEKEYKQFPEKQNMGVHKWLTYVTLFISGLVIAGDLITVLYYFIDGQELTTAFLLKVLVLIVIATGIFTYYLSDARSKLTPTVRNIYRGISFAIVIGSIVWGFVVLGSPRTQRLYKYDDQKVSDLMSINNEITNYYSMNGTLPKTLADLSVQYYISLNDAQTQKPYEYEKLTATSYNLCAEFNKVTNDKTGSNTTASYYGMNWLHGDGRYCFKQTVNPNSYTKPVR